MAKAKAKYDIKFGKDANGCTCGSAIMKRADGSLYVLSFAGSPETKMRTAKAAINTYMETRIPEFINEFPGSVNVKWDDYFAEL